MLQKLGPHCTLSRDCKMEQLILTVCLALIIVCWGQLTTSMDPSAMILESPGNHTLPVNSTAVFTCTATGFLFWQFSHPFDTNRQNINILFNATANLLCSQNKVCINGTLDNSPGVTTSQLLVAATSDNSGSKIRCLTALDEAFVPSNTSDPAFLKVYDHPDPPTSFSHLVAGHLQLKLLWDTSVAIPEVASTYIVHISNVNRSDSVAELSDELHATHYIFNGTEEAKCDVYQFSVVALNDAGRSEPSTKITTSLPTLPDITASMHSLRHRVVIEDGQALISISFEPAGSCPDYPVTTYSIMLHSSSTDMRGYDQNAPFDSGNIEIELGSEEGIEENVRYSFSIMAVNSIGNVTSNTTECFTTDVQSASVLPSDSDKNVLASCQFAEGSPALGCHIQLRIQSSIQRNISILRQNESLEATSGIITLARPLACYDICAFDWESDSTTGELCVPVRRSAREDCGSGPTLTEPSGPNTQLIIGAAIGGTAGFLLILIVVVAAILLMSCYCMRARQVRAKSNDYGDGYRGNSGKYKKGVNVEVIPSYHPATTERSDSQATTVTILPDSLPPVYDAIQNYSRQDDQDSGEKDYSGLTRTISQHSPTARADFDHDPQYSALNQVPTYAVLETNSVPLGILPRHQEAYCEIDDLKRHESTAVAVSVSDPSTVPENERLYSEIPSAGTTV